MFSMYPTYSLMEFFFPLKNEVDDTVPKEPTIDMFLKTICKRKGCKCFDIVLGSDSKKQGTQYNKSRCILK